MTSFFYFPWLDHPTTPYQIIWLCKPNLNAKLSLALRISPQLSHWTTPHDMSWWKDLTIFQLAPGASRPQIKTPQEVLCTGTNKLVQCIAVQFDTRDHTEPQIMQKHNNNNNSTSYCFSKLWALLSYGHPLEPHCPDKREFPLYRGQIMLSCIIFFKGFDRSIELEI